MTKMFIVTDRNNGCGIGSTLEDAFEDYKDHVDNEQPEDLDVYEANEIEVEFKIVKKTQPVKVNRSKE